MLVPRDFFEEGAGITLASVEEQNVALFAFFELMDTSRPFSCFSAGASFFVARFPDVFFPQILEHMGCAQEVPTS